MKLRYCSLLHREDISPAVRAAAEATLQRLQGLTLNEAKQAANLVHGTIEFAVVQALRPARDLGDTLSKTTPFTLDALDDAEVQP